MTTNYDFNKKVRKTWTINPVEKIKKSKKKYNRNKNKRQSQKEIDDI